MSGTISLLYGYAGAVATTKGSSPAKSTKKNVTETIMTSYTFSSLCTGREDCTGREAVSKRIHIRVESVLGVGPVYPSWLSSGKREVSTVTLGGG
jgi:hypothetical protein